MTFGEPLKVPHPSYSRFYPMVTNDRKQYFRIGFSTSHLSKYGFADDEIEE